MAQNLTELYEKSKIGPTLSQAFTDAGSTVLELLDDARADANRITPAVFILRPSEDVHLRQGPTGVAATVTDFLLVKDAYYQILAEDGTDNQLAMIAPSGGAAGSVFATKVSSVT